MCVWIMLMLNVVTFQYIYIYILIAIVFIFRWNNNTRTTRLLTLSWDLRRDKRRGGGNLWLMKTMMMSKLMSGRKGILKSLPCLHCASRLSKLFVYTWTSKRWIHTSYSMKLIIYYYSNDSSYYYFCIKQRSEV